VLLLHGFPDTGDVWRHQVPALATAGLRTIVPDLRGRGRSERPQETSAYALPELVADATGILDAFGWLTEDLGAVEAARAIEPLCILWCIPGFRNNEWSHAFKLLKQ